MCIVWTRTSAASIKHGTFECGIQGDQEEEEEDDACVCLGLIIFLVSGFSLFRGRLGMLLLLPPLVAMIRLQLRMWKKGYIYYYYYEYMYYIWICVHSSSTATAASSLPPKLLLYCFSCCELNIRSIDQFPLWPFVLSSPQGY